MTDPPTSQDCALLRLAPALKQAREERGLSLAQVATDLKLPQHVLEHLEHGQQQCRTRRRRRCGHAHDSDTAAATLQAPRDP